MSNRSRGPLSGSLPPKRFGAACAAICPRDCRRPGDRGLDRTHTWGRTYWGGALFCLAADVEIRRRTGNAKGLQDALRAINHAGGTIESEWPLDRALRIGDEATQGRTLAELYRKMASQPFAVDLDHLWEQLGVGREWGRSVLDDRAPWAGTREAICGAAALRQELKSMTEIRVERNSFRVDVRSKPAHPIACRLTGGKRQRR